MAILNLINFKSHLVLDVCQIITLRVSLKSSVVWDFLQIKQGKTNTDAYYTEAVYGGRQSSRMGG